MAQLPVEAVSLTGSAPNLVAASAGGDVLANDGRTLLRVTNANTAATTVTVTSVANCNFGYNHNLVVNVAAGATVDLGPFAPTRFNDANGNVDIAYSAVTALTVGGIRV